VDGDTHTTAGLFRVQNAGAGALCMVCHNSRSGAIRQGTYTLTSWQRLGPHNATQGDMFAGRNAFFISNLTATDDPTSVPNISAHAFMADTCVDCHVKWVPADVKAQYSPANTNHTFRTTTQVCAECHADNIGDRIQESISAKMATLTDALSAVLQRKLTQVPPPPSTDPGGFDTAAKSRTDPSTGKTLPDPIAGLTVLPTSVQSITAVSTTDAVIVLLTDGSKFQVGLDKINKVGSKTAFFDLTDGNTQITAKAYFNLLFVNNDGAKGIHNPSFAGQVLDNATAALGSGSLVIK
jgi:hypothetical protein